MDSSSPIGRRLLLAACLVLAALVVAGGGASSLRKIESFQPLGFQAQPTAGHWLVTAATPGDGVTLEVGDEILLVNGDSFARVGALEQALRSHGQSELVLMRGGELETVSYVLPSLEIDYAYLVLALIGCTYLLIGFYTLLRDQRGPALVFFLWTVTSATVYLFTAIAPFDLLDKALYIGEEFARVLLAPLTLHLFTIFPRPVGRQPSFRWIIPFLYLPAAFLLLLQIDLLFTGGQWLFGATAATALAVLDRLELFHLVFFGLAAAGVLGWRLWKTRQKEAKRQTTWIALGLLFGYAPFALLYVLPRALGASWPDSLAPVTVLFLAIVPITFCYAILRHRLWDLGVLARDSAALALTVLIGVSGFALANLLVNRLVPENVVLGRNLLVFVSGLSIAGLMVPTRRGLGQSLARLQYRGRFGRRRALAELGKELLTERDLDRLCIRLSEEVEDALDITTSNVLLRRQDVLVAWRPEPRLDEPLPLEMFPERLWDTPLHSIPALGLPEDNPVEIGLFGAGYRYIFPLQVRDNGVGLFVCGHKEDGVPLNSDDVDIIRTLLNQTALAIENAQLLREVQTQLDEVGRLRNLNKEIVDSSPAGIVVLDETDRILSANKAFTDLVGATKALTGKALLEVFPIRSLPNRGDGLRETSYRNAAGEKRYVQVSAGDLADPQQPGTRVLVVQDVSQRVAMETALKEKDRLASLGVLVAGVAHEVNTPITGISSYAQMLLETTSAEDPRRQLLEKVETQTFRAARIVNNLLNFARKREGEREHLDLIPLVGECLELLRERMLDKRVTLAWQPDENTVRVRGNEGELQQVITNLVMNAIDAMQSNGGTLTVDIETDERWVWIGVEDTGPGIPLDELENIFEPFYSTKLAQGGTGLGLSISHDLIKSHGGDIRVISHPGEGCRFVVELPIATDADA